ncbi:hypothetical Protein YC6258_03603 [Gynuella sunshinyii YC6258]|uniref:Uncharacterized protein n=1 Tax=Gynuella sunshinyii YC6258 TaxID=1445510 RepID=A0A0C5VYZ0_9GAMM|nr:hypothetical Protein YC6258_03603 [Gynuella sunshinyii YC6258]
MRGKSGSEQGSAIAQNAESLYNLAQVVFPKTAKPLWNLA